MITDEKITEIFFMADNFCQFYDELVKKYTISSRSKRKYHRDSTLSKSEIMVILILFHMSGFRCLKHFYLDYVCKHLRHLFPRVVSYNRFVEIEKTVAIPLTLFIKKVLLGKCTGISFIDSTPLRTRWRNYYHSRSITEQSPKRLRSITIALGYRYATFFYLLPTLFLQQLDCCTTYSPFFHNVFTTSKPQDHIT